MHWHSKLYIGNSIKKSIKKIKKDIENGKIVFNIYLICFSINENNMLDIYNANELRQKYYNQFDLCVVGIGKSKEEALEVTKNIITDVYKETGECDVRNYFNNI